MGKRWKEIFKIILFLSLGIGVAVIFWIRMSEQDKTDFLKAVGQARYEWLAVSFFMGLLSHWVRAWRWKQLLEVFSYKPKMYNLFFAVMNMYFFNMLVPRLGEITRCGLLRQYEGVPMEKSLGSVVAERAVDLLFLLLIMGLAALVQLEHFNELINGLKAQGGSETSEAATPWLFITVACLFLLIALAAFLFRKHAIIQKLLQKVHNLLLGFWDGLKAVFRLKRPGLFLLQSAIIWALYFGMSWVCFLALPEIPANWKIPLSIMAAGSIAIIVVPGGIGAFPVIVAAVLALPHLGAVPESKGLALGWIIWGAQTLVVLIAGALSIMLVPVFNRKNS